MYTDVRTICLKCRQFNQIHIIGDPSDSMSYRILTHPRDTNPLQAGGLS